MQDIHAHGEVGFPTSLPSFQKMFPDDAACAAYLEKIRWEQGFVCPHCAKAGEPFRFANRPHVLRCRSCRSDIALTAGTVMERTHTPLSVWFWGAYLVASLTPGMSAVQFQRQLGLSRYATAHAIYKALERIKSPGMGEWSIFKALIQEVSTMKRGPKPKPLASRFARFVNVYGPIPEHRPELGACCVWTGALHGDDGYGVIHVNRRAELAHRVAFYLAEGRWPEPCALHHCDNRLCVRRSHLFEGTKSDNTADMVSKQRGTNRILSPDKVQEIFDRKAKGETQTAIAKSLGISPQLVSLTVRHRVSA